MNYLIKPMETPEATAEPETTEEPTATEEPEPTPEPGRLAGLTIGIDPGHQEHANNEKETIAPDSKEKKPKVSSGTSGVSTRIPEYITVLEISFKLRDALKAEGAEVYMTRESHDVNKSNQERAKMMNELIEVAKERDIQLIVETHSDHVLNTALRAVNERRLGKDDLAVLFFSNYQGDEGFIEARVRNLDINSMGHILNPPKQFFEQYSTDLRALYAPPVRHE